MATMTAPNIVKQVEVDVPRSKVPTALSFEFTAPKFLMGTENQKNYVFVDEHNRHKRLKVMRACEGCRRRKIKCDAATTNTWPCAACVRLKLHCVPPLVHYDRENNFARKDSDRDSPVEFGSTSPVSAEEDALSGRMAAVPRPGRPRSYTGPAFGNRPRARSSAPSWNDSYVQYLSSQNYFQYTQPSAVQLPVQNSGIFGAQHLNISHSFHPSSAEERRSDSPPEKVAAIADVSGALGELKIDVSGVAPFISDEKQNLANAPAFEDADVPTIASILAGAPDATVRVPPQMMPSEERASRLLAIYFENVHPYVPVLDKAAFYDQWHNSRHTLSPLLIEAVFASAIQVSNDPSQGPIWLALAQQHKECFFDVPRLTTVQAMLILLKARETAPQRGYFFRSWMTVVQVITMALDLQLDKHIECHSEGRTCDYSPVDCIIRTRIWQTVFVLEYMIGSPQGRYVLSVKPETVANQVDYFPPDMNEEEREITNIYSYFTRFIKVGVICYHKYYHSIRNIGEWQPDPGFRATLPSLEEWEEKIPKELKIVYPEDGSEPWIPSHFAANLEAYYNVVLLTLHRPMLHAEAANAPDDWRDPMKICCEAAKKNCRVHETILRRWGIKGIVYMLRGVNCAVYEILACLMIHLTAMTCPDPEFSKEAPDFFSRHMRVLEKIIAVPLARHFQRQVNTLRQAFSADLSQPFVLKPDYVASLRKSRKPAPQSGKAVPPLQNQSRPLPLGQPISSTQSTDYTDFGIMPHPITTPPLSDLERNSHSPINNAENILHTPKDSLTVDDSNMLDTFGSWKPGAIFDQWSSVFSAPERSPYQSEDLSFSHVSQSDELLYHPQQMIADQQLVNQMMNAPIHFGFDASGGGHQNGYMGFPTMDEDLLGSSTHYQS